MTEHSEPRRWTLTWGGSWVAMAYNTPEIKDGQVRVREDKACEADVEAILPLIEREDIYAPDEQARAILAAIFKEGGEGS